MTATLTTLTGITTSTPEFDALEIDITDAGVDIEITVAGRFQRTGGSGSDQIIAQVDDTAGSGSFSGLRYAQWSASANGDSSFSISCVYTPSGSGPWTLALHLFTGGGLGTFAVADVSMRATVLLL